MAAPKQFLGTRNTEEGYVLTYNPTYKMLNVIDQLEDNLHVIAVQYVSKNIVPKIIAKIQENMMYGGSNQAGLAFPYWERKRGDRRWNLKYPNMKMTNFTWSTKGNPVNRLPIHPNSYGKRSNRRFPARGEFALFDTGRLITSLKITNQYSAKSSSMITIGSTRQNKLDVHEFGDSITPRRPTMLPVYNWFMSKDAMKRKMMMDIMRATRDSVKEKK